MCVYVCSTTYKSYLYNPRREKRLADFKDIRREGNSSCLRKSAKKKTGLENFIQNERGNKREEKKKGKQTCTQRHLEIVRVRGT